MQKKVKIGIVGLGSIAGAHIAGYEALDNVEIYALCDINEERLKKRGEQLGVTRLYTDIDDMLAAVPELDAISVCTWNNAHAKCSIAALKAGKHVLCEKPMAMNTKEAEEMKKVADESGKLLMIGFVRRHGNDCQVLRDFISAGSLGDIYYGKVMYLRRNGCPGGWFGNKSLSGGGPLIDLGVHVIDLTRYLMGNPKPISVYGATFEKLGARKELKEGKSGWGSVGAGQEDIFDVEDLATALIRYDNGAVISVETSFSLNTEFKEKGQVELFGTKGGAKMDPDLHIFNNINGYMTNVNFANPTSFDFSNTFKQEIAHFISCITDGTECIATAQDGIEVMKILDGIYESAKTGHEVIL